MVCCSPAALAHAGAGWGGCDGGRGTFVSGDVLHLHVPHLGHVAQHGEDDEAREEAGEAVHCAGHQRIPAGQRAGMCPMGESYPGSAPPGVPSPAPHTKTTSEWGRMLYPVLRSCGMQPSIARLQELTGSSCCGRGCNWPEREGHRTQGPGRRRSVRQHPPKPGRRSNRQGWGYPMAWGWGLCWHMLPDLLSCLPHSPGAGKLLWDGGGSFPPWAPAAAGLSISICACPCLEGDEVEGSPEPPMPAPARAAPVLAAGP